MCLNCTTSSFLHIRLLVSAMTVERTNSRLRALTKTIVESNLVETALEKEFAENPATK